VNLTEALIFAFSPCSLHLEDSIDVFA